jgi:hypothetical protein
MPQCVVIAATATSSTTMANRRGPRRAQLALAALAESPRPAVVTLVVARVSDVAAPCVRLDGQLSVNSLVESHVPAWLHVGDADLRIVACSPMPRSSVSKIFTTNALRVVDPETCSPG